MQEVSPRCARVPAPSSSGYAPLRRPDRSGVDGETAPAGPAFDPTQVRTDYDFAGAGVIP